MCGIVGVIARHEEDFAGVTAVEALKALQHRGQSACGAATTDGGAIMVVKDVGLVRDVFPNMNATPERLPGRYALGHVRYPTSGNHLEVANAQPFSADIRGVPTAVVHNGNITNAAALRRELEAKGRIFTTGGSDTELILHLMADSGHEDTRKQLIAAAKRLEGAYTLLVMTPTRMLALVDPRGYRPVSKCWYRGGILIASESHCFAVFGERSPVTDMVSIGAGQVVDIDFSRLDEVGVGKPETYARASQGRRCSFELAYFARPDSEGVFGRSPYEFRQELGRVLAEQETLLAADYVIGVPDSGIVSAEGYAHAMRRRTRQRLYSRFADRPVSEVAAEFERAFDQFRFVPGVVRDHYIERVFIEPEPAVRGLKASLKHSPVDVVIKDSILVVVDDSVVRGDTGIKFNGKLRKAGAKEIHLRVATPQIIGPCYWGLDTPERDKLIAWTLDGNVERIAQHLGCDSLAFVPLPRFREVARDALGREYCFSCFDGTDPTQDTSVEWYE